MSYLQLFVGLVTVCLLLEQQCVSAELNILQLKVNISASEKVLNSGSNFTLLCEGIRPIHWETPPDSRFHEKSDSLSRTRTTVKEHHDAQYKYSAELQFTSIDVSDVGSYVCRCNSSDEIETSIQNKSVYIYVKDQARLIAPMDVLQIASQFQELIVPCKPSSPDVSVTLLQDGAPIVPGKPFAGLDGRIVTYDPQIGFTIPDVQMQDSSYVFTCQGVLNSLEDTEIFFLLVRPDINVLPKPEIYEYSSCDGKTVLNCKVRIFIGIPFIMKWRYPNKDNINKERVLIVEHSEDSDSDYTRIDFSTLTILNTTSEDMGLFKCEISGLGPNITSDEIFMYEDCKKFEKTILFLRDKMPTKETLLTSITILLLLVIFVQCCLLTKKNTGKLLNKKNIAFVVGSKKDLEALKV